jgi:hypothetical protein
MWYARGRRGRHTERVFMAKPDRKRPFVEPRIK